jgi:hypothetical protein
MVVGTQAVVESWLQTASWIEWEPDDLCRQRTFVEWSSS